MPNVMVLELRVTYVKFKSRFVRLILAITWLPVFDGKIGLFPCTEKKPTQRKSKAGPIEYC